MSESHRTATTADTRDEAVRVLADHGVRSFWSATCELWAVEASTVRDAHGAWQDTTSWVNLGQPTMRQLFVFLGY